LATETVEQTHDASGSPAGPPARVGGFFAEVQAEMKRVTWPSQREVSATTIVVIATSVIFGLYLFGVDLLISRGVQWILQRFGAGGA
jgi:preprotein translocase subunit SecE